MKSAAPTQKAVLSILAVAVLAVGCSGSSSSPTAPLAAESGTSLESTGASQVADFELTLWASLRDTPEMMSDDGMPWLRMPAFVRFRPDAPARPAVLRCDGRLMDACGRLGRDARVKVLARRTGKDGTDWLPLYKVIRLRTID